MPNRDAAGLPGEPVARRDRALRHQPPDRSAAADPVAVTVNAHAAWRPCRHRLGVNQPYGTAPGSAETSDLLRDAACR